MGSIKFCRYADNVKNMFWGVIRPQMFLNAALSSFLLSSKYGFLRTSHRINMRSFCLYGLLVFTPNDSLFLGDNGYCAYKIN